MHHAVLFSAKKGEKIKFNFSEPWRWRQNLKDAICLVMYCLSIPFGIFSLDLQTKSVSSSGDHLQCCCVEFLALS